MLVYDDTWLREPNLLVPGKKPIGPVRIKQSHPYVRLYGLRHFFLVQPGGLLSVGEQWLLPYANCNGNYLSWETADSTPVTHSISHPYNMYEYGGSGGWNDAISIVGRVRPHTNTNNWNYLISLRNAANHNFNAHSTGLAVPDSTSTLAFHHCASIYMATPVIAATYFSTGNWHTFGFSSTGIGGELSYAFVDGVSVASVSNYTRVWSYPYDEIAIGSSESGNAFDLEYLMFFSESLPDEIQAALHRDPYQLIEST